MKKLAFILGILVMAASLVTAGWWLGSRERTLTHAIAIPMLDTHLTGAAVKALILHQLDSGQIDDARHMLQLQLDGEILVVDSLIEDADGRSRDLAQRVLARIAAYRAEHPASYTGRLAHASAEVDAKIADILRRAGETQTRVLK